MLIQLIRLTAKKFPKTTGKDLIAIASRLGSPIPSDAKSLNWLETFNSWLTKGQQLGTCVALADAKDITDAEQRRQLKIQLFGALYGK